MRATTTLLPLRDSNDAGETAAREKRLGGGTRRLDLAVECDALLEMLGAAGDGAVDLGALEALLRRVCDDAARDDSGGACTERRASCFVT